ncbi:hypothetical protein M501DRAFT_992187 [Patellaria atrata CBS 101060]|uniref:Heterokaryon incompatibility domain-containing protein n=1 Tax=Patellaria atrata CBS 101060 TaxID=1346257 RepID=A0A9P4SAT6_9PEZI|nr:hypothetical protein M501DRAFT_992187 [Patellaria atrata CBS 101060]
MEPYAHIPLPTVQHICLISPQPAVDSQARPVGKLLPLNIHDQDLGFASQSPFEALSYVWGDRGSNHYSEIGGRMLPITKNCDAALRQLRPKRKDKQSKEVKKLEEIHEKEEKRRVNEAKKRSRSGKTGYPILPEIDEKELQPTKADSIITHHTETEDVTLGDKPGKDYGRLLWVDAVCIDRTNEDERSSHVTMMGDIYEMANTVNLYLGEGETCPMHISTLLRVNL